MEEESIESIAQALRPMIGHIVSTGKDIIIDLGDKDGILPGDLFTVYVKDGPVSAEAKNGLFKRVRAGVLKVMEVRPRRAKCRVIVRKRPIPTGSEVERFSGLRAVLMAHNPDEAQGLLPLHALLKERLWWLDWTQSNMLPSSFTALKQRSARFNVDMIFVASRGGLDLYDFTLQKIGHYPVDLSRVFRMRAPGARPRPSNINSTQLKKVGVFPMDAREVHIVDCDGDGHPEVYVLNLQGIFVQEYGSEHIQLLDGTSSTFHNEALSFAISCEQGLLALNKEEPGVGLHSSVLDISGDNPHLLCEDVNLWFGFYKLAVYEKEVLLGQVPSLNGSNKARPLLLLSSCSKQPQYSTQLSVPKGFDLRTGWIVGEHILYVDSKGKWIAGRLGKSGLEDRGPVSFRTIEGFLPRLSLASPVTLDGDVGLIVPVYNPDVSISRLYFVSFNDMTGTIFSDPLDGEIVGLGILGPKLYLAVADGEGETKLFVAPLL